MIIVISPAKRLDFSGTPKTEKFTLPRFIKESSIIMNQLKKLKMEQLGDLMNLSGNLAEVSYNRIQNWEPDFNLRNARQAMFSFKGDAYIGLDADSFKEKDLEYAQDHLRILSGLHGILKPLDLIRPYRLEMGLKINIGRYNNLYDFWGSKITDQIETDIGRNSDPVLVNLASNEYFKSIKRNNLIARVVTPVFKEFRNGEYRIIQVWTKKARGLMTSFIIRNKLDDVDQLKLFDSEGYFYNDSLSTQNEWVFTRDH